MDLFTLNPFEPGCFWYDLHKLLPPNLDWCEGKVCSLIVTPYNTWTNLGYVAVGLLAWYYHSKHKPQTRIYRFYGSACIATGLTSFLYHMSLNFYTQLVDFIGMYIFCMTFIMINLKRLKKWPTENPLLFYWASILGLTLITVAQFKMGFPYQLNVAFLALAILLTELMNKGDSRKYFSLMLFWIVFGETLSLLDLKRVFCDPDNHWLQGHGLWHLCGSICLYYGFKQVQLHEAKL